MIDPYAELVQFDEALTTLDQRVRGRMARVVAADGHMVTVELPGVSGWDGPLGPYPATVAGLAPGRMGVLEPLRGGQALFVAIGRTVVQATQTAIRQTGRQQTTSVTEATTAITRRVVLDAGRWELNFTALSAYKRSVATGGVVLRLTNNQGWPAAESAMVYDANVAGTDLSYMPIAAVWTMTAEVPAEGLELELGVDFRGDSTAGTTYLYGTILTGAAVKVDR